MEENVVVEGGGSGVFWACSGQQKKREETEGSGWLSEQKRTEGETMVDVGMEAAISILCLYFFGSHGRMEDGGGF